MQVPSTPPLFSCLMSFHVYILQSQKNRSYYIGHTQDPDERLARHNEGRSTFTKAHRPGKIVFREEHPTRSAAMRREREIKGLHRRDLLADVINRSG